MTTILFVFALLTTPTDRYICDLWTRALTLEGLNSACPIGTLENYRLDVYDLDMKFICSRPANSIMDILAECSLPGTLDNYVLRIIEPGYYTTLCFVDTANQDAPTQDEIDAQCPEAKKTKFTLQYAGTRDTTSQASFTCPARILPSGFGLYDQAISADDLHTDDDLTWLAGQLIWNGLVKPTCGIGLDARTQTANGCGNAAARSLVVQWQNQFDAEIFKAAIAYNVPAKLLKRMISIESQFWPFWSADPATGEIGIMQVTDNGLDTMLRFDTLIDPNYLNRDDLQKAWSRNVIRQKFLCLNCSLQEAVTHIKNTMPYYARLIAAFECRAVTINPALTGAEAWRQAVVDYNGSGAYLERIEQ